MKRFSLFAVIAKLGWLLVLACSGCADPSPILTGSPEGFKFENAPVVQPIVPVVPEVFDPPSPPSKVPDPPNPGVTEGKALGGTVASTPVPPAILGEIYYYQKANCPPCLNSEFDQKYMPEYKFIKALPDAWSKRQTEGFPHFRWIVKGNWTGEAHGWYGPAWFCDLFQKSFKAVAAPAVSDQPNRSGAVLQHRPLFYGQRPSTFDWPGELRHHLTQPPHNYPRSRVDAMSDSEVIRAHDSWHNRYGALDHRRTFAVSTRSCPT